MNFGEDGEADSACARGEGTWKDRLTRTMHAGQSRIPERAEPAAY